MTPQLFCDRIVAPTQILLGELNAIKIKPTDEATVMLMAIAGQESGWRYRRQIGGPARSYWQFEKNGGVAELFQKTPVPLSGMCEYLDIPYELSTVFEAMAWNDTLACTMARLLLWQDRAALPAVGEVNASWDYYRRNWRPGAPHPDAWPANYSKAVACIRPNINVS